MRTLPGGRLDNHDGIRDAGAVPTDIAPRRFRPARVAVVITVLALTLMWVYAYSGLAQRDPPDFLDDPRFAAAAEQRCRETLAELDRLPVVTQGSPPDELAAVVEEANDELADMVADLGALAPTDGGTGRIVGLWLADWATYLDDRVAWAERVRAGDVSEFVETDRGGGEPMSRAIDNLAEVNDMSACVTP